MSGQMLQSTCYSQRRLQKPHLNNGIQRTALRAVADAERWA